jgi:hypothetical protein
MMTMLGTSGPHLPAAEQGTITMATTSTCGDASLESVVASGPVIFTGNHPTLLAPVVRLSSPLRGFDRRASRARRLWKPAVSRRKASSECLLRGFPRVTLGLQQSLGSATARRPDRRRFESTQTLTQQASRPTDE